MSSAASVTSQATLQIAFTKPWTRTLSPLLWSLYLILGHFAMVRLITHLTMSFRGLQSHVRVVVLDRSFVPLLPTLKLLLIVFLVFALSLLSPSSCLTSGLFFSSPPSPVPVTLYAFLSASPSLPLLFSLPMSLSGCLSLSLPSIASLSQPDHSLALPNRAKYHGEPLIVWPRLDWEPSWVDFPEGALYKTAVIRIKYFGQALYKFQGDILYRDVGSRSSAESVKGGHPLWISFAGQVA